MSESSSQTWVKSSVQLHSLKQACVHSSVALLLLFKCSFGAPGHYPKIQSYTKPDQSMINTLTISLVPKSSTQFWSPVFYDPCITFQVGPEPLAHIRCVGLDRQAILLDGSQEDQVNWTMDSWVARFNISWCVLWKRKLNIWLWD